jgi:tetratricopeptide (TPR) repeat protein
MNYWTVTVATILLLTPALGALPGWDQSMLAGRAAIAAGNYLEAERLYQTAIAQIGTTDSTDMRLGLALGQLGAVRLGLGHFDDASNLMLRSIHSLEAQPAQDLEALANAWQGLASCYYYRHLFANAGRAYQKALDFRIAMPQPDGRAIAGLYSNLGSVYQMQRRLGEARASLAQAMRWLDRAPLADPLFRAKLTNNLGDLHRAEGKHADAERLYRAATDALEAARDTDGILTSVLWNNLAIEHFQSGNYAEAVKDASRAVERLEAGTVLPRTDVIEILNQYRRCLKKVGDRSEIKRLDSRTKRILNLTIPEATDRLVVDASQLSSPLHGR